MNRPSHQEMMKRLEMVRARLVTVTAPMDLTARVGAAGRPPTWAAEARAVMQRDRMVPMQVMAAVIEQVRLLHQLSWPEAWLTGTMQRDGALTLHGQKIMRRVVERVVQEVTDLATVDMIEGAWATAAHGVWLSQMYVAQIESLGMAYERLETPSPAD